MGRVVDPETGFQYLQARYYDPATGQFISRDPLDALTRSAYSYVNGNPLNAVDLTGLAGESPAAKKGRERHCEFDDQLGNLNKLDPRFDEGPKSGPNRPDGFFDGDPVELKPDTPSGLRAGLRQIGRYIRAFGTDKGYLVLYDPNGAYRVILVEP